MASFPSSFGNADTPPAANPSLGRVERLADVSPGLAEGIFLVVALLFFSNAQLVHSQATDASQLDPTAFAIQALLYGCFAPFLLRERVIVSRAGKCLIGVWALIALAFCSALWSQDPSNTLKHSVLLLVTIVFGIYFGARFSLPEQLRILALASGWAVALKIGRAH